jgi:hypothetical protein
MAKGKIPSRILLVEGKDDMHVMKKLCEHHEVPECFVIENKEGVTNVLEAFEAEIASPEKDCVGILIDADTDLPARWDSIKSILTRRGYTEMLSSPHPNGTIINQEDKPTIGIWLMPNNHLPGELEDFIAFLVPQRESNPLWNYAKQCLDGLPDAEERYPEQDRSKAHVHTWLAWQKEPGKPLGQALTARYINADAPNAKQLIEWLKSLFINSSTELSI